jgi:hypothetical protein
MKQTLNYGRISWDYDDFDPKVPCRPTPLIKFSSIRINGVIKHPRFSDKISLQLLKHKAPNKLSFREAYRQWYNDIPWNDHDLGEGRAFLRWLQKNNKCIEWKETDMGLHTYFYSPDAPKHDPSDELAQDLSFAIKPVEVEGRRVKLYLKDEAVLSLLNMPYGEEHDFLDLVKQYIKLRFQWELWNAPAVTFLDWVNSQAKRPIFQGGQLGFYLK